MLKAAINILIALLLIPSLGHALTGKVISIADGDTITILESTNRQLSNYRRSCSRSTGCPTSGTTNVYSCVVAIKALSDSIMVSWFLEKYYPGQRSPTGVVVIILQYLLHSGNNQLRHIRRSASRLKALLCHRGHYHQFCVWGVE